MYLASTRSGSTRTRRYIIEILKKLACFRIRTRTNKYKKMHFLSYHYFMFQTSKKVPEVIMSSESKLCCCSAGQWEVQATRNHAISGLWLNNNVQWTLSTKYFVKDWLGNGHWCSSWFVSLNDDDRRSIQFWRFWHILTMVSVSKYVDTVTFTGGQHRIGPHFFFLFTDGEDISWFGCSRHVCKVFLRLFWPFVIWRDFSLTFVLPNHYQVHIDF